MKRLLNNKSEKTHYATLSIINYDTTQVGEYYRIFCSGREVLVPFIDGEWILTESDVDCSQCLKKEREET